MPTPRTFTLPALYRRLVSFVVCAVALFVFAGVSAPLNAQEAPKRQFDIPADAATKTLKMFSQQSGRALIADTDLVRGIKTNEVKGEFSVEEAMNRMLEGTGLVASKDAKSGSYTVMKDEGRDPNAQRAAASSARPSDQSKVEDGKIVLDTFEVMGRKSLNMDRPRSRDDAQPYVVFNHDTVTSSGATNLEEFFKMRLTMNQNSFSNSQSPGQTGGTTSRINLRGLGTSQTLILVDGRRLPTTQNFGSATQSDINGIPLEAVERVEILPSTASGIYGGGATGGVINIITRRDYSGVDVRLTYGNTFDSDVGRKTVDLNIGLSFEGGKTQLRISGSHSEGNQLFSGDRDFENLARQRLMAVNPSAITAFALPPLGSTTNIRNSSGANLVLKPQYGGATLSSPFTHVPVGYAGITSDNATGLIQAAGTYNLDLANDKNGNQQVLLIGPSTDALSFSARRDFSQQICAFVDFWWDRNIAKQSQAATSFSGALLATAPNNPFTTNLTILFPNPSRSAWPVRKTENFRSSAGVIVKLPKDWMAEADVTWGKSTYESISTSLNLGDPDGTGPGKSFGTAVSDGSLDLMRDLGVFPLDYSLYLLPSPNAFFGPGDTIAKTATVRFAGPFGNFGGGPVTWTFLTERREEERRPVLQRGITTSGAVPIYTAYAPRFQTVDSAYLEARVPLVAASTPKKWARDLEIQASIRYDYYTSKAGAPSTQSIASASVFPPAFTYSVNRTPATSYTAGFRYSPIPDLVLRASVGTGFLPPSVDQITFLPPAPANNITGIFDPKRGNILSTIGPLTLLQGGNPNLTPERSRSVSVGLILQPRLLPDFRLSIDYTKINKTDEITSISNQQAITLEDLLPGRVTRDPLTASDAAFGYTAGVITGLNVTSVNAAKTRLEAIDVQMDYSHKFGSSGTMSTYVVATWQPVFDRQLLPILPFDKYTDRDFVSSGSLLWKASGGLSWRRGNWTAAWNSQYYDSYKVWAPGATAGAIASAIANQGSDSVPSQLYHDFQLTKKFGSDWHRYLSSTEISVGVQNVFNKTPPIITSVPTNVILGSSATAYSLYGDPRLRRYTISVKRHF